MSCDHNMSKLELSSPSEGIMLLRMNRPERLNAMGEQLCTELAEAWSEFESDPKWRVGILTGTGRGFCAGEDLKEAADRGRPGLGDIPPDPFLNGLVTKPTIVAVNGWAVGGGVTMTMRATLRVAARAAKFQFAHVKHWGVGAWQAGTPENLPTAIAAELALGFVITGERAYQTGWINRLTDDGEEVSEAIRMAEHLTSLRARTVQQTVDILAKLRPTIPPDIAEEGAYLRVHGVDGDIMDSRRNFRN